jgi:hypothetical protein
MWVEISRNFEHQLRTPGTTVSRIQHFIFLTIQILKFETHTRYDRQDSNFIRRDETLSYVCLTLITCIHVSLWMNHRPADWHPAALGEAQRRPPHLRLFPRPHHRCPQGMCIILCIYLYMYMCGCVCVYICINIYIDSYVISVSFHVCTTVALKVMCMYIVYTQYL